MGILTQLRLNLSTQALAMGRKYSSHINRENMTIEVKREE